MANSLSDELTRTGRTNWRGSTRPRFRVFVFKGERYMLQRQPGFFLEAVALMVGFREPLPGESVPVRH